MRAARHPSKGSLNDPAAMQNPEPFGLFGFVDDFKLEPEFLESGRQLPSPISAVRPDFPGMRRRILRNRAESRAKRSDPDSIQPNLRAKGPAPAKINML